MILVAKYNKKFPICMISHIDLLRVVNRVFRRSGVEVKYSEGFNPHMEMYFSPPLSLGIESLCEYVTVYVKSNTGITIEELNKNSPQGMEFTKLMFLTANPNLAAVIDSAVYTVVCDGCETMDVKKVLDAKEYFLTYDDKGTEVTKDVRNLIVDIAYNDNGLQLHLKCGNINLKPERLLSGLANQFGFSTENAVIVKTAALVKNQAADDFLGLMKQA